MDKASLVMAIRIVTRNKYEPNAVDVHDSLIWDIAKILHAQEKLLGATMKYTNSRLRGRKTRWRGLVR